MEMIEDSIAAQGQENTNHINMEKPPKTPNYGKTPKYLHKFKEEAKQKEERKIEEKAAKQRPPGTRVLPESERIQTLEKLQRNKGEVLKILNQLPISMRTESLRQQKIQMEQKLEEIEKAIATFSRKTVYVRDD